MYYPQFIENQSSSSQPLAEADKVENKLAPIPDTLVTYCKMFSSNGIYQSYKFMKDLVPGKYLFI